MNLSALIGILRHFKLEFRKKKGKWSFFRLRGVVGWKKVKKKKKKIFFKTTFSLAVFLFPVIKWGEKVSGFVFFRKGRGKI